MKLVSPRRFNPEQRVQNPRALPYLLITPILLISFGLVLYPIVQDIYISTTDKTLGDEIGKKVNFVGLKNYESLLGNEAFLNSLKVTLLYAIIFVVLSVGAGLLTAILVNKRFRGRGGIRALMTAPWAFPFIWWGWSSARRIETLWGSMWKWFNKGKA